MGPRTKATGPLVGDMCLMLVNADSSTVASFEEVE